MKTKSIFIFSLIALVFWGSSFIYATNPTCTKEKVDLVGELSKPTNRSSIIPFEVIKDSNSLSIYYLQNLSNINIEITDEFGQVVYSNKVNPTIGSHLQIDMSYWEKGSYSISFTDGLGSKIYGTFEL